MLDEQSLDFIQVHAPTGTALEFTDEHGEGLTQITTTETKDGLLARIPVDVFKTKIDRVDFEYHLRDGFDFTSLEGVTIGDVENLRDALASIPANLITDLISDLLDHVEDGQSIAMVTSEELVEEVLGMFSPSAFL